MQTEVLPSELHLVVPPTLPQARSYMFKQLSDLQEYDIQKGNRIRVNIPRLQRSYLMKDSYIRFRVNLDILSTATNKDTMLYFDRCGAYGLFDRIEVYDYLGGTLLEQTQNVPALITTIGDLTYKMMDFNGGLSSTQGYDGSNIQVSPGSLNTYEVRTASSGALLYKAVDGDTTDNAFVTYEFCLPVPSFLGMFSEKYIPLHNGFSIDFFLNSRELAFVSRKSPDDTSGVNTPLTISEAWISNFEYCCQVMELGEQAESMVIAQEPMVMHSNQFRYFSDIILGAGTQSTFRLDMNLNVVSLRNIRFGMRPYVYQALAYPAYGHRIRNFLNNYNFQYGSSYLPEIAGVDCRQLAVPSSRKGYMLKANYVGSAWQADYARAAGFNQSYMEVTKTTNPTNFMGTTINSLEYMIDLGASSSSNFAGALTGTGALVPTPGQSATPNICGKFIAGIDTRLSKKNTVSGIDTNGLLVSVNGAFDRNQVSNMTQAILDVYAEFDAFIQVIPGVATTVTF